MDSEAKIKHSKRLQQKANHIRRQEELTKNYGIPLTSPHRYQKTNVLNCGNPKCIMCANPRKIFKEKTIQEKRFDQTLRWREYEEDSNA